MNWSVNDHNDTIVYNPNISNILSFKSATKDVASDPVRVCLCTNCVPHSSITEWKYLDMIDQINSEEKMSVFSLSKDCSLSFDLSPSSTTFSKCDDLNCTILMVTVSVDNPSYRSVHNVI